MAFLESITLNGIEYINKSKMDSPAASDGLSYVIVRTYSSGVFAGYLKKREGQEVTLVNARRFWYWEGAASLSQAAMSGFSKPGSCKFPEEVSEILLLQAIEILNCTEAAKKTIDSVPTWKS